MLIPGRPVPPLELETVGHGPWSLEAGESLRLWLLVFYRGLHCPICSDYVSELDRLSDEFKSIGVEPVAISMDSAERAHESVGAWGIEHVPVAYGLSREAARDWGLFVSSSAADFEPEQFSEPALFLVRPNGVLYGSTVNSMPFARASFQDLLIAVGRILEFDPPERGKLTG